MIEVWTVQFGLCRFSCQKAAFQFAELIEISYFLVYSFSLVCQIYEMAPVTMMPYISMLDDDDFETLCNKPYLVFLVGLSEDNVSV